MISQEKSTVVNAKFLHRLWITRVKTVRISKLTENKNPPPGPLSRTLQPGKRRNDGGTRLRFPSQTCRHGHDTLRSCRRSARGQHGAAMTLPAANATFHLAEAVWDELGVESLHP